MTALLVYVAALSAWRLVARADALARAFAISSIVFLAYNMFDWEWYVPALAGWFVVGVVCLESSNDSKRTLNGDQLFD